MRMTLTTWNSHSLNDTSYKARSPVGVANGTSNATPNYIDMGEGQPILGSMTLAGAMYTFTVHVLSLTDAGREAQRDVLLGWFIVGESGTLVGTDDDDTNKDWYLSGRVVSAPAIVPNSYNLYQITIALDVPYWIENDLNTNTWNITAATETEVMTNVGNVAALPKMAITPNTAKSSNGNMYKTFYAIKMSTWSSQIPVDITSAGLNTSTLVGAGKMLATGYDLQINYLSGGIAPRYFGGGGINSATTGVWSYIDFIATPPMTLSIALNNSTTPATIIADYTGNITCSIASGSQIQIENEVITFSTITVDTVNKKITFVPTTRAAKGSSIASHSAGEAVFWITGVWLSYGDLSATAQPWDIDLSGAPAFDLATSTNALWNYLTFSIAGTDAWTPPISQPYMQGVGQRYTVTHNGGMSAVWGVIGSRLSSIDLGTQIVQDTSSYPGWVFRHPGGISNFTANGEKYRSGAVFGTMTIEKDFNNIFYTEASPTDPVTWKPIAINQALAINPTSVAFRFVGPLDIIPPLPEAMVELSDAALTIYAPPVITALGVEQVAYSLNGTIKNSTTSDIIRMNDLVTKTAETITIDCDTQEVYATDGKRVRSALGFEGPARDEWLTLEPGANSIVFADVGTADVTIVTTWRARNTI